MLRSFRVATLIFLALGVALVLQEFAVRLALPVFDPAGHLRFARSTGDLPALGPPGEVHRLVKNSGDDDVAVRFNRHGLRDVKDIADAVADDILLVGDSCAFGWGVKEADRLSERLQKRIGRRVFNVAMPADIDGYEKLIGFAERRGGHVGNVILVLNMTDDLRDYDAPKAAAAATATEGAAPVRGIRLGEIKEFLLAHSAFYFLATSLITQVEWLRAIALRAGLIVPLEQIAKRAVDGAVIDSTARRVARLARRFRTTIVIAPMRGLWIGANTENERRIHERFIDRLGALGLDIIDMRPLQERGGKPMEYHFTNDGHWNPSGHALAAGALAARLAGRNGD